MISNAGTTPGGLAAFMITTFTLNPSIDRMLYIEGFQENAVNRVASINTFAGGKGINVSKVLRLVGSDTVTSGIVAGENGNYIEKALNKAGFKTDFLHVEGETRINTKIYDILKSATTDINEPGPNISHMDCERLIEKATKLSEFTKVMVYAGSIPPGIGTDIYRRLVEISLEKGCSVILDCDKGALQEGIKAKPTLIKPNINEMEALFSRKLETLDEISSAASRLIDEGIKYVAVSMGSKGVCLYTEKAAYFAKAVNVSVKGTVGAGDSMVAIFAHALDMDMPPENVLPLAVSASAACVCAGSTGELDEASIYRYVSQAAVKKI